MTQKVIAYSYLIHLVVVAIIALFRYPQVTKGYLRILIYTLLYTTVIELTAKFGLARHHMNNTWLLNISAPVSYFLLSTLYYGYFTSAAIRRMIRFSQIVFPMLFFMLVFALKGIFQLNNYGILLMAMLLLSWVCLYFRRKLDHPEDGSLKHDPMFWISTAIFFFYGASIFVFGTLDYFVKVNKNIAYNLLGIIQALNILMNSLYLVALLCKPKQTKS